ncbi:MAG TPA: HAD family hydrolase [Candidatus Rubrimentiphilum sp.]|nr:HAD family hydrolase [Candidatus Rubrimentiphilum sp.]
MPPVKAVGFDIDHTLGIDNKLERVAFLRLLDAVCEQGGRALGTLAQESARIDDLLERQRSGAFSIDEAVERFAAERGARSPSSYVEPYKRMAVESVPEFFVPQTDARMVLAELKRRHIPCAILSNGWPALQERKAQSLGFDGPVLVGEGPGTQKPGAAAFAALARALSAEPGDVAYVGDNPRADIAAAIAAGMHGIWLDAEGAEYPPELPEPSEVIHSLTELLTLL